MVARSPDRRCGVTPRLAKGSAAGMGVLHHASARRLGGQAESGALHLSKLGAAISKNAYSSVPRTWTTFTNERGRERWCTCMGSSSRVVAILAAARPSRIPISTKPRRRLPAVSVEDGFVLTSVGLAKCPSNWMGFIRHWTNALCFWPSEPQEQSNLLPALQLRLSAMHEPSISDWRNLPTRPTLGIAIWVKPVKYCPDCSPFCDEHPSS